MVGRWPVGKREVWRWLKGEKRWMKFQICGRASLQEFTRPGRRERRPAANVDPRERRCEFGELNGDLERYR